MSPFAPLSVYKNRISEGATLILTLGVGDDSAEWTAALERLLGDRDATRAMAHNAQHKAHEVGDPLRVLDFWRARSTVARAR